MSQCPTEYERICRDRFDRIDQICDRLDEKLDRIDRAIRGNGKDGLAIRTDRLEQSDRLRKRFFWVVVVATIGAAASAVVAWLK